jgi:glycosyltransferase involved in cell wall biosynthesis
VPDDAPYLLDVTRLIWRRWKGRYPTGIDRVCLAYLRHFGPNAQAVVQYDGFRRILNARASRDLFSLLEQPSTHFKSSLVWSLMKHLRPFGSEGGGRFYLNVGHTGLNSARFARWAATANVKPVYLVHDLIPITHPRFCRAGEARKHSERMRTVLLTASGVIGNSQATLDDLVRFAGVQGLKMPPALAAWLGMDPLPVPTRPSPSDRPSFVVLGTIEGRKNHQVLLNIWSRLVARLGREAPKLLIIGQRGWEAESVFHRLDGHEKLGGHLVELSHCSDQELADHFASARAVLFPSFAEGYGLPLVEALGMGVPVIASDLPVFREIAGQVPVYLSPLDDQAWEQAILDYASPESPARAAQLERIKSFRPNDWQGHFDRIETWLRTLG